MACAVLAVAGFQSRAFAGPLTFTLNTVGAFGGEPSIASDSNGRLYETTPSGNTAPTYKSLNQGTTWGVVAPTDSSGDDCLATDQSNAVYWCNLDGGSDTAPLQADVWKSTNQGASWTKAVAVLTEDGSSCGTSCQPFGVDRQWTAASILSPTPTGYTGAEVVLMYHDFYGPSSIWVNISKDGGTSFGNSTNVLASLSAGSALNSLVAEGYTFCSTVPAGVGIVPNGAPHAGRIIVSWMAEDPANDLSGCNLSMAGAFHTLWVSYSDDNGATWTAQQAFDAGVGHDASTPFMAFNLDNQGNPYIGFATPAPSTDVPAVCAADSLLTTGALQSDHNCDYKMQVVWSADAGATWHHGSDPGGLGPLSGAATTAYIVNGSLTGTSVFPTIAAGDPGHVDVSWLQTEPVPATTTGGEVIPTDAAGKFLPLGCDRDDHNSTVLPPPNYPPRCHWDLYGGQSLNLTGTPGTETWSTTKLTAAPMHYGDICNLGIACPLNIGGSTGIPRDPRHLLDFNQETIDPTAGCAHISYADDNFGTNYGDPTNLSPFGNQLMSANQTDGPSVIGTGLCSAIVATPETPLSLLLPLAGVAAAVGVGVYSRRRKAALVS